MTRRTLVTGGAGFIGTHLCESLLRRGHEVVCLDNLVTGTLENVERMRGPRLRFVEHDVTEPFDCEVDEIYNLACPASPTAYQRDPIHTLKTSVVGALNVLELARRRGARVLQVSTSEVYGDPIEHPQVERYTGNVNCNGPRACYDEGKRAAETLFCDYQRVHGVDVRIARVFNTYGPRMQPNDGRVVTNFLMQALEGRSVTVYGDGSQTRSLCYVADLVRGLEALMSHPTPLGPVNLGNPEEVTILQLARIVGELVGHEVAIETLPLPQDDPRRRRPDITRARELLGWQPKTSIREGLGHTLEYLRQHSSQGAPA